MKQYIGTKIVQAEPALRLDNGKHGVRIVPLRLNPLPGVDDTVDLGYRVVYEDGYQSWSPQDVFEKAYRETTGMPFGLAIEAAKKGVRIARRGWNGKGMYVFLADNVEFHTNADVSEFSIISGGTTVHEMLVMRTAQRELQPGWLASQADMLADDWYIVE